jgi:hypothetical protein
MPAPAPEVLNLALRAVACATTAGDIEQPRTLTLIDYSKPSTEPRLWVLDLEKDETLFVELVAHGRNTGDNMATQFSDRLNSHQSSLGLFVARDPYVGSNGYSLRRRAVAGATSNGYQDVVGRPFAFLDDRA